MSDAGYGPDTTFHMAPPLITRLDPATGRRRKLALPGRLMLPLFRLLRHGKRLRGTALDPFGWQRERRMEQDLIAQYEADMTRALASLRPETVDAAVRLASLPQAIRGFGPVKEESRKAAQDARAELLAQLDRPDGIPRAA